MRHNPCPKQVSQQEEQLRWLLYQKKITFAQYEIKRKKLIEQNLWGQRKSRSKSK
jgi:hypothetical protein